MEELQLHDMTNNGMDTQKWMTIGKMILYQKDLSKGNTVDNNRPISCLPPRWKLMTGIIANSVNVYLEMYNLLPVEHKGCKKRRDTLIWEWHMD